MDGAQGAAGLGRHVGRLLRCDLGTGGTVAARSPGHGARSSREQEPAGPLQPRLLQGEEGKAAAGPALGRWLLEVPVAQD